jgi:dTDP-glucose 4,6-dehydratase
MQQSRNAGSKEFHVETLSRNPDDFCRQYPDLAALPWLRVCRGDILDRASFSSLSAPDWVLHAAADSTRPGGLTARTRYEQIVDGTRHVLDFAAASGSHRFLFVSSGGVYGAQPAELARIPESFLGMPDPLLPGSTYGVAKRAAEHLCATTGYATGMSVVIARCFAFVGEDLPLGVHFAIGNFIRDALWSDEVIVRGDGLPTRSYMDQRDLASWLLVLLERGLTGRAYNVGSDFGISMIDLAELVVSVVSPGKPVRVLGEAVSPVLRDRYVPSIARAGEELGLSVTIPLVEAIRVTAEAASRRARHRRGDR